MLGYMQAISMVEWTIIAIVVTGLTLLIRLRLNKPHSFKKRQAQIRIEQKQGKSTGPVVPHGYEKLDWLKSKFFPSLKIPSTVWWSVGVIIAGIAALYYAGFMTEMSLTDVSNFSKTHWIQILIIWGVCASLIQLNVSKADAPQLHKIGKLLAVTLLIILPCFTWFTGEVGITGVSVVQKKECSLPISEQAVAEHPAFTNAGYTPRDKWISLTIPPGGNSCHVENPQMGSIVWDADNPSIHTLEVKCVYEDLSTGSIRSDGCRAKAVVAGYVHNPTNTQVTVWYAYAKKPPSI